MATTGGRRHGSLEVHVRGRVRWGLGRMEASLRGRARVRVLMEAACRRHDGYEGMRMWKMEAA